MKQQEKQTAITHKSQILNDILALGTQEEYARTESRMVLAAKIDDALKAKGISKKQFAEMMGRQPSVITKWLSGGHNFTVDTLTDIQGKLGVRLLALDAQPEIQIVFRFKTQIQSAEPSRVSHPSGQIFSLPSMQTDEENAPRENFQRQLNVA
jgi:transcriptional regulator with XRE-family HTH domain